MAANEQNRDEQAANHAKHQGIRAMVDAMRAGFDAVDRGEMTGQQAYDSVVDAADGSNN